jgi:tetratricopeptide (TPR) repeat protein/tRNA A-37 threonylcarbamoyl transferase component Bud32
MGTMRWATLRELFESALEVPAPERDAWLDAQTDDAALRSDVLALLKEEERSGGILSRGALPVQPPWNADELVGRTVGGYSIVCVLARGGMGVVYEARQQVPSRDVALKTLRSPYVDQEAQRRFRLEVEVLGLLQHPGIAQIFDGGVLDVDGRPVPYLAMELVPEARDLVRYAEEAALGLRARCALLRSVCDAVHEGHRRGIVHRDLKPANILVDGAGRTKVIDFGLARVLDSGALAVSTVETIEGRILGTLDYMSPEHVSGHSQDIDVRSDVYSLGCVLHELCTGRTPLSLADASLSRAVYLLENEVIASPRGLPRALRAIIMTALARNPQHRYGSAVELAHDLLRFERGETVLAQRTRAIYALSAFSRRHRVLLGASAAVILALGFGLWRATRATALATSEASTAFAISDFLSSMMRAINAYDRGPDARIVDMLASGVETIDDVPDARARAVARAVLGEGLMNLGDLQRAGELLESGARDLRELATEDTPARLQAEVAYADYLEQVGRYDESLTLSRRLLPIAARRLGGTGRVANYLRSNIGVCLGRQGAHAEAEAAHREALSALEAAGTQDVRTLASVRERIAHELIAQERLPEARQELEATWALLQSSGAAGELMATSVRNSLAQLHIHSGEHAQALEGFLLARDEYRARGGTPGNLLTVTTNIAQAYASLQRPQDALRELELARELCKAVEPTPGRQTHTVLLTLARSRLVAEDFEEARAVAEEALALGTQLVSTGHPNEPINRLIIARAEQGLGRTDVGLEVLAQGEEAVRRVHGPTSREILRLRRHRVDMLIQAGRVDEGNHLAREALEQLGPETSAEERAHWAAALAEAGATGLGP